VLSLVGQGRPFDEAFETATGEPLRVAVDRFWSRQRQWGRWIPFLAGPAFLWMVITLLALYAIRAHRRRRTEQRRLWEAEEQAETEQVLRQRLVDGDPGASGGAYEMH
jgi:di/tricarboxylate transporter